MDAALARQTADMPGEDHNGSSSSSNEDLRKKLWLRIARHVVEEEKDVQRAMSVLQQCPNGLLKIEDVLPFFPDFTTIDLFKDAISQSLQEYSHHLEVLKEEMEEATKAADSLRQVRCISPFYAANERGSFLFLNYFRRFKLLGTSPLWWRRRIDATYVATRS